MVNIPTGDQELLAVCQVLLYDQATDSMFARVRNADVLAETLAALESDAACETMVRDLCEAGVVWQVLYQAALNIDPEVLYDQIAETLSEAFTWGSSVVGEAAKWAIWNRRHVSYDWLQSAVLHVSDTDTLKHAERYWPKLRQNIEIRLKQLAEAGV